MYLLDHQLSETGGTRYSENMNIVVFFFQLTLIKKTILNKQESGIWDAWLSGYQRSETKGLGPAASYMQRRTLCSNRSSNF